VLTPCYLPTLYFTGAGGSSSQGKKKRGPRTIHHQYDEGLDRFVDPRIARDRKKQAAHLAQQREEAEQFEAMKKARYDSLLTMLDLNEPDFADMRRRIHYEMEVNSMNPMFWRHEQELIFKIYAKLKKAPVCPMCYISFAQLKTNEYFKDALWVAEKLGLHHLMSHKQNYNIEQVHQF